ncbi:MAG: AraC family transcriptional regulator [Reyranella sp.]|nr:AraC family transcriptional regulator [Reyranella sp.]
MREDAGKLVLAGSAGRYREFAPVPILRPHFRCVWSNELTLDTGSRLVVVPDGCVDLTWVDGRLLVAGPDVSAALSKVAGHTAVIGIRFRPGAASAWLGLPLSEIVGQRIDLGVFWGRRAAEISRRIGDASTAGAKMQALQAALCPIASDLDRPGHQMEFVFDALKAGPGMAAILERLDVSPRSLRRHCHEAFGYGPKTLHRILRFQRFLDLAKGHESKGLADLAFAAGFSDQAHLTREVRRLTGFTTSALLVQAAA